jgi:DNA invertase Pin-like site-specific DNA recombinase
MTGKIRAACYLRVSTNDQKVDLQKDAIEKFLDFKGLRGNAVFFVDQGESGAKVSRPAFDRMMKRVRANDFDVVITWKFDRIGRSTIHLIQTMNELRELKVNFISIMESVDTTTEIGRLFFSFLAAIAEFERDTIRNRTKAGMTAAKDRGVKFGPKETIPLEIKEKIRALKADGVLWSEMIKLFPKISPASIYRIMKGA